MIEAPIKGDSTEYELLNKWADPEHFKNIPFLQTCEIGVREGLGSKIIMDRLNPHIHFAVDPYGNLNYQHYDESGSYQCDYTDDMMKRTMAYFTEKYPQMHFFKLKDTDFMNHYHYLTNFSFVHFDGPHMTKDVIREAVWFADRAPIGARFVFDDYPKYGMFLIKDMMARWGFEQLEAGSNKICLQKNK